MGVQIKHFKIITIFIVVLLLFHIANTQDPSKCVSTDNCEKCLLADISCAWCTDPEYGLVKSRCMSQVEMHKSVKEKSCRKEYVLFNHIDQINFTQNEHTRDFSADRLDFYAIQIQPQRVHIKLKKSQTQTFTMKYKPAKNYPLDLYYLMDLTDSMANHKAALIGVGEKLANALNSLSENYRIGFGSFVDKPVWPYLIIGSENNPCAPARKVCAPTYGFWHQMGLSKNITKFIGKVNEAQMSGNLDDLEGGFDALMQILVCESNIGWNEKARKIVIYASDGKIHFAGEGMLAGIVKKNDKKCYLNEEGHYLASKDFDYPSIEEIYRVMIQKKINVVFAVTRPVLNVYDQLHIVMQETTSVGVLAENSSNIIDLVRKGYQEFIRRVQFSDNAPDYISVSYEMNCGGEMVYKSNDNIIRCEKIELGKEYDIKVKIQLLDYPPNPADYHQTIKIEELSLSAVGLDMDLTLQEICDCSAHHSIMDSDICNNQGNFTCGKCTCNDEWSGRTCNCNLKDYDSIIELTNSCRLPSNDTEYSNSGPICSDRGDCVCGECFCNQGYIGNHCECLQCPIINGKVCGGNNGATCDCGKCVCDDGWTGDDCNCPTTTDTCLAPHNEEICSGEGECKCGTCDCNSNYFGTFCEYNAKADNNELCSHYEPCVRCMILRKQQLKCDNISDICRSADNREYIAEFFNDISDANVTCIIRIPTEDDERCEHRYTYRIDHIKQTQIRIVLSPCKPIGVAFFALGIFLLTVFLGLVVIVVMKVTWTIKDRREYARFEEDKRKTTNYNMSPIYKSPITTYNVPRRVDDETETEIRYN